MSHNLIHGGNLLGHEVDEVIHSIDDIAEGGWEMAALATLMYASAPIQNCLNSGSVSSMRVRKFETYFAALSYIVAHTGIWMFWTRYIFQFLGHQSKKGLVFCLSFSCLFMPIKNYVLFIRA